MADDMSRESIRRVKKRIEEELLALPNVHAVDIGEKITNGKPTGELSIVVYVDQKKNVAAKNTVPPVVDGVKTDVQEEEPDVLHPALIKLADDELLVDTTRYTTLEGGMSIGPCRSIYMEPPDVATAGWYITVGTLGVMVRDNTTNDAMALTNFHVAAVDDTWTVGDAMAQPARNDGGSCPADRFGQLERGVLSANVDGAVIAIDGRPHNCEILDIGEVTGTRAATVGMAVRKAWADYGAHPWRSDLGRLHDHDQLRGRAGISDTRRSDPHRGQGPEHDVRNQWRLRLGRGRRRSQGGRALLRR